jgi:hypothetical protein
LVVQVEEFYTDLAVETGAPANVALTVYLDVGI